MSALFIKDGDFPAFVAALIEAGPVYGPVAKRSRFVFEQLESPEELRLEYDVTILPPKKLFFSPAQDLLRFDGDKVEGTVAPVEKVLLGVHFYDVKGIDQTDLLFSENNYDVNYMANRETTTIVASNVQNISPRAFFGSVGADVPAKGHDASLTKIGGGYVFEPVTDRGEALVKHGAFQQATDAQVQEAASVNAEALAKCPEKHSADDRTRADKVAAAFDNEALWSELAEDCFSCGSCNTVCPTCYCFNVEDTWNVDAKSGQRTRYWDACLTPDFAQVSLGEGATENFRDSRGDRFRHRFMRKSVYLNEKLGQPACVGCGRCSAACTADIADPVKVIDRIMAS